MSNKGSVFQKGGGGTNFEQYVQTAYLTTLIVKGRIPCIPNAELTEVAFQTTNRGYETDDLLAVAQSSLGQHRLLAQIKHNLTISNNSIFKEVIAAFWKDFNNEQIFDTTKDRLLIIKSGLTKNERNHVRALFNWAKTHNNEEDFFKEVNRIKAKLNVLNIFIEVLEDINDNQDIPNTEIWNFLKCLELLEYDFGNEVSIHKQYFLNLIQLIQNEHSTYFPEAIWNELQVLVAHYNPTGGSFSINSLSSLSIYQHFNPSKILPFVDAIQQLEDDSQSILRPFSNQIRHQLHINRTIIESEIVEAIHQNQLTVVTGNAGTGKSALIKDIIYNDFSTSAVFVFRADQFNTIHLSNVFSAINVFISLKDLFNTLALIPEKLIVIDSLEKLLEAEPEQAFHQLLSLLETYPDIKILATSRSYAVDLIAQKFNIKIPIHKVFVPLLNEKELEIVATQFPQLNSILPNRQLKSLIRTPKYLDILLQSAIQTGFDFSDASIVRVKQQLWNTIIENTTIRRSGLSRLRHNAFMNIAVERAKRMKLFVEPNDGLENAIEALEADEIIFRPSDGNYHFAPTHDIFEDWALIKYIERHYESTENTEAFFEQIGTAPAMRRAFRLWVEDNLLNSQNIHEFIHEIIDHDTIEPYWIDETLIAIFKSEDCAVFFEMFQNRLFQDNGDFLLRCIFIIKTTCKERYNSDILQPLGSGWSEILAFIAKNIETLDKHRVAILELMKDWQVNLWLDRKTSLQEPYAIQKIVLHFIQQVETEDAFWQSREIETHRNMLISLFLRLADISKMEITGLIERSFAKRRTLGRFYKEVINQSLSHIHSKNLVKELPELVIETAWKQWKLEIKKPTEEQKQMLSWIVNQGKLRNEECWGIKEFKFNFFPSGIYKTFVYNLLLTYPVKGVRFINDFINYSIDFYLNADCDYKKDFEQVEIKLNDGTKRLLYASPQLWEAYRGLSVTHYALECLLMSLEKYLLQLGKDKSEISKKNIEILFDYLLRNTNNITVCSVLTSVTMAYPLSVGRAMLPLLTVKEFYFWDTSRCLHEHSATAIFDDEILFAQKEKHQFNKLPHRRKYMRGWSDFILQYQFNIAILNKEIFAIFEDFLENINEEDILWKKKLTEIYRKKQVMGQVDKEKGIAWIYPNYDKDVKEFVEQGKEYVESRSKTMQIAHKTQKAYENKEKISFKQWLESFKYYQSEENLDYFFDNPVTLATIGLRDFNRHLVETQRNWCIQTIIRTNQVIIHEEPERYLQTSKEPYNVMEKETAFQALSLVFPLLTDQDEQHKVITLIIQKVTMPLHQHEVKVVSTYLLNDFFIKFPDAGKKAWRGIIEFARLIEIDRSNEVQYIANISNELGALATIDTSLINFDTYNADMLSRVMLITPFIASDEEYQRFILKVLPLILEELHEQSKYPSYQKKRTQKTLYPQFIFTIRADYLPKLLLYASFDWSTAVFDLIMQPIFSGKYLLSRRQSYDLWNFCMLVPKQVILHLDNIISHSDDDIQNKQLIAQFWKIWEYFFEQIKSRNTSAFVSILLFGGVWKEDATHWQPLNGKRSFYKKMVMSLGQQNIEAVIHVLSTIGNETFLPKGIQWLVDVLKKYPSEIKHLASISGERLIRRLYHHHIHIIKNDKRLINDYIWILNEMIRLNSSNAYEYRELVFTYKSMSVDV